MHEVWSGDDERGVGRSAEKPQFQPALLVGTPAVRIRECSRRGTAVGRVGVDGCLLFAC